MKDSIMKSSVKSSVKSAPFKEKIRRRNLDDVLKKSLKEYGTYVLEERAIPSIEDGLKPVQRRILWALSHSLNSSPDKNFMKCARVSGEVMGKYHPHGDSYNVLVNMVEGATQPLIEGHGNFGGPSDYTPAASSRYTECRISKFTNETYFNSRYDKSFPKVATFDSSNLEPVYLPAQLPMILALQQQGIAMGTTTNIPAFSTESLYLVTQTAFSKYVEKDFKLPSNYLMKMLEWKAPYGGQVISNDADKLNVIKTGKGSIEWSCDYVESLQKRTLTITGIGPNWSYDNKKEKISELPYVASVADMSDDKGMKIVITLKRCNDDLAQDHLDKLKKMMLSRVTYRCNVVSRKFVAGEVLDSYESTFSSMSIIDIISYWCKWRMELEKTSLTCELEDLRHKQSKIDLMIKAVNNIDIIFKLLKQKNIDKVKVLAKQLQITEEESKSIWAIAVGRLDRLSFDDLSNERKAILSRIKEIKILHRNPEKSVLQQLKNQGKIYIS
jgi:DNA gyrase subunit A